MKWKAGVISVIKTHLTIALKMELETETEKI